MRLRLVRNVKPLSIFALQGFNLFALSALFLASYKGLDKRVKSGLIAPYNCWANRLATLKFVQDIPLDRRDPSYGLLEYVDKNLHQLSHIPTLICWGERDFVFDTDYLSEWRRRFPKAEVYTFSDAGHYVLEDVPDDIVVRVKTFLQRGVTP
jgi:haloalkane dehalogenase